jgi:hypothetical protein
VIDLRGEILRGVAGRRVSTCIADDEGIVVETTLVAEHARSLGLTFERTCT